MWVLKLYQHVCLMMIKVKINTFLALAFWLYLKICVACFSTCHYQRVQMFCLSLYFIIKQYFSFNFLPLLGFLCLILSLGYFNLNSALHYCTFNFFSLLWMMIFYLNFRNYFYNLIEVIFLKLISLHTCMWWSLF